MSGEPAGRSPLAAAFLAALPPGVRAAGVLVDPPGADGTFFRVPATNADDVTISDARDELTVYVGPQYYRHFEAYCSPHAGRADRHASAAADAAAWVAKVVAGGGEPGSGPPEDAFPAVIRWGRWGIVASVGGVAVGGATVKVLDGVLGLGLRGGGVPGWMWPCLAAVWAPGIVGLLLPLYAVARYPYFSFATTGGPRAVRTGGGIFVLLGGVFLLVSVPFGVMAAANVGDPEAWFMAYLAVEFAFVGWLLARYRPDRHPTVATWLALTFGFGVPLAPFYLPSILVGSRRLRRALRAAPAGGGDDPAVGGVSRSGRGRGGSR